MLKYAKIINTETRLCEVGLGTNETFYKSIGMSLLDVIQSDIDNNWYLKDYAPMKTESEKAQEERQRLDLLNLTKADVLLALYADKALTPDDIKAMLKDNVPALIKFDYASSYYRGDEVVNTLGLALGYSTEEMDYLFENKKFPEKVVEPTDTDSDADNDNDSDSDTDTDTSTDVETDNEESEVAE